MKEQKAQRGVGVKRVSAERQQAGLSGCRLRQTHARFSLEAWRSRSGSMMMEYVIVTLVMAVAVLFASTWLFDWDGGDAQDHDAGVVFQFGDVDFVKDKGAGPEIKAMYQRVHAGIALPAP